MKTYNEFITPEARKRENENASEQRRAEAEQKRAEHEREAEKKQAEAEKIRKENEVTEAIVKTAPYVSKPISRILRKAKLPTHKSVTSSISKAGRISNARALTPFGSKALTTRTLLTPLKPKPFNPIKSAAQATKSILKRKANKILATAGSAIKDKLDI